ncbi:hypothetical protein GCM10017764_35690 [Sphingobacterium griseoflavum]|uniref:Uncharacterized protein n=2 Tax=Sphingobacterium griseoflavum TaxID=1474952 RepID=A0ABQ3HZ46_9SPHI|nr:hypothetical protein GCM10017764_35690 [Sphingobacterium griseoflavum]
MLSVQGAFQRANCYHKTASEKEKAAFRSALKNFIDQHILPAYKVEVSEEQHEHNILRIIDFSRTSSSLFVADALNVGISQKLLNLYLKYHWCIGEIATPPHFPVDRIIQQELKMKPIEPWTRFKKIEEYREVINHAKTLLEKEGLATLAELELAYFNRRATAAL